MQNLEATQGSVSAAIMGNATVKEATVSLSTAPEGNTIEVGATNPSLVDAFLKQQFGQNAPISVVAESPFKPYYSRYNTFGPVYGGSAIVGANHGGCTAGFSTRSPSGVRRGQQLYLYFVLTAGHYYAKGMSVGRPAGKNASTALEFGKVRRSASLPEFVGDIVTVDAEGTLIDPSLRSHSVLNGSPMVPQPIQGQQRAKVDRWACWSGVSGGHHCGKIARMRENIINGSLNYIFQVNGASAEGDSGAPVWDPITHKAIGVLSGGIRGGCWFIASGAEMCPRTGITPLLPRPNTIFPEGALPKMGLKVLGQG